MGPSRYRTQAHRGEWTYPLETEGHFAVRADDKLEQEIKSLTKKQFGNEDPSAGSSVKGKASTCR
jgi:hypothetical protein